MICTSTTASASYYNAAVDILLTLAQSETTQLQYGKFAKPSGSETLTVDMESGTGSVSVGGSAANKTQFGTAAVGVISITGDNVEDISIIIDRSSDSAVGGLLLSDLNVKYGSDDQTNALIPSSPIILYNVDAPSSDGTDLKVAGKLNVDSSVSGGATSTIGYTVDVVY